MRLSVCFTNFGPYHLARLRALAGLLADRGDELLAYEVADAEILYPWDRSRAAEPFAWTTLFPGRALETIPRDACAREMARALDRDRPDALGIVGYSRPESMAMLRWGLGHDRTTILMSESQELDHPRSWWKEAIKRGRVRRFSAGLVGGPRHRDYLAKLGMPYGRIALGYNAVDNAAFAAKAATARADAASRGGLPARPYFLATNRFVPEKNLVRLVRAYARYRQDAHPDRAWDLVLCGGGPAEAEVDATIAASGLTDSIRRPGFLQEDDLARHLAHASAFVHPSLLEPWGLVVNEAAACGLPLLVSDRAGCVETLVPDPDGTTGRRFDPRDEEAIADGLAWMAGLDEAERSNMGRRAAGVVADWGPGRFALGTVEALGLAAGGRNPSTRTREDRLAIAPRQGEDSWKG
jgi:1,2-diacylglycerol 3-alpha-glucosyltransferase